jgi:hypothetical protein
VTRDFFDELRNFNASRGIGAGLELRNRFHQALNLKRLSPTVLALSERDFEEFRRRVYNVLERVDSIGFMTHILERE